MNKDFSRIITLLRKEKGLSQKQVAADLGVSQALLSHYEKGIRECGLDFVIKVAGYYDVSTDYLLGRTVQRNGAKIAINDLPEITASESKTSSAKSNILSVLNKRLIVNSIELIFDLLEEIGSKGLTTEASNYLMISVYKMFRTVYSCGGKNPKGVFSVDESIAGGVFTALQSLAEAYSGSLASGNSCDGFDGVSLNRVPNLSPEIIAKKYPLYFSSLFNLIKLCEDKVNKK
ncbi:MULTISPECIES: helix-turn-helix domain-containing protein [unclassified Ruminococcus]|uniref:helix-turn-helix domain-containing protein n=1 Tax=unclassified Ruminococcus TaxID=2608920 RepID=UPI00210B91F3|nr:MULTISPECIES: helix-turn-helix domain-containing protein [unclassified Ruminococcus]MCQ4022434.1 helix-turn-helix domain-containing protein [Ruminococcus sp. zg-924]MCQ4114762.1 helix-turn-helix domain-containing protein [Ruminococcus sp. zg-921]